MLTTFDTIILGILIILCIAVTFLLRYTLKQKNKKQMDKVFIMIFGLSLFWMICEALQIVCVNLFNANPIYFDYFSYIGVCYLPVSFLLMSMIFARTKINFNKKYMLLFIIPTLSIILLWTNNLHHLFYEVYSKDVSIAKFGVYFPIHTYYTYILYGVSLITLIRYSIKNSGFFSKQAVLIIIGILIPVVLNILGFNGIAISPYITPISFAFTIIFLALAIFKFDFLSVTPIALQRIVDRMSDSYIVLGDNWEIIDFNKTLITTFKIKNENALRGKNLEEVLRGTYIHDDFEKIKHRLLDVESSDKTIYFELSIKEIHKYFNVEINSIISNGQSLGTLILFKDITQHKRDIQTIKDTQDSLMESERLSSLGQLIGGIAHNLKTPIMSIAGAAEGLTDLVKEYDESIDDPTVNSKDHHEIAADMSKWINKIKEYSEYMSDVITAVKGQAVVMANEDDITFTVSELIKRINILMKHELKNAIINLNISCNVDENLSIHGDVNNLVQVINNMISNAIQAYNGKTEESIEFIIGIQGNNVVFSIEDHAGGLPDKVKDKLFKEMITTKGKNGTGLGLYMSYSTIKAHFNGNISFETEKGKGTRFDIAIPVN